MASIVIRAVAYAASFIGLVLVWLPAQALARAGVVRPARVGPAQVAGGIATLCGAALVLWCVATFAFVGRGTPAPFDPPRRLVVRGPYRHVRNPMYLGAILALCGGALFYETRALVTYAAVFAVILQLFVVLYEEPTLRATFGEEYEAYRLQVRRWWPRIGCRRPRASGPVR
jgi:protein-S-isoprenylcysteine O-methyltransferase Ste14